MPEPLPGFCQLSLVPAASQHRLTGIPKHMRDMTLPDSLPELWQPPEAADRGK